MYCECYTSVHRPHEIKMEDGEGGRQPHAWGMMLGMYATADPDLVTV